MTYSSGITSDDEDMENQMVGNGAGVAFELHRDTYILPVEQSKNSHMARDEQ